MLVSDVLSSGFSLKLLSVIESVGGDRAMSFISFSTYPALNMSDSAVVDKL